MNLHRVLAILFSSLQGIVVVTSPFLEKVLMLAVFVLIVASVHKRGCSNVQTAFSVLVVEVFSLYRWLDRLCWLFLVGRFGFESALFLIGPVFGTYSHDLAFFWLRVLHFFELYGFKVSFACGVEKESRFFIVRCCRGYENMP